VVVEYARERHVYLPIIESIYKIVNGLIDIKDAADLLM
jgi:glycerol-3-phosphate dehydrogenase